MKLRYTFIVTCIALLLSMLSTGDSLAVISCLDTQTVIAIHQDVGPTAIPTPQPTVQVFIPVAGSGAASTSSGSRFQLLPDAWLPYWDRYGSLFLLIPVLLLYVWLRKRDNKPTKASVR
ncbi:MAG: hypothetical protein JW981_04210 [Anaerolineae bacterium]|nr:hypothetical protein [Anaerolineae bacterium]